MEVTRRRRGRPTLEDVAEIENQLLSAALREFVSSGYGGASMRSIAKAAGISRSTLLARFASKEELFQAIMAQQISRMDAGTFLRCDGDLDLKAGLRAFANRALSFSLEGDLLEVNRLIYSALHHFPELSAAASESTRIGIRLVREFIEQYAAAAKIKCENPGGFAENFVLLLRGWYGFVMLSNQSVSVSEREEWVENMVDGLILGLEAW